MVIGNYARAFHMNVVQTKVSDTSDNSDNEADSQVTYASKPSCKDKKVSQMFLKKNLRMVKWGKWRVL